MDLQTIFQNQNVTVSITGEQLALFASQLLNGARELYETKEQPEQYIPRKEAATMLGVDLSSLWRWNRQGFLCPTKVGGKLRYRLSDIRRILEGGGKTT